MHATSRLNFSSFPERRAVEPDGGYVAMTDEAASDTGGTSEPILTLRSVRNVSIPGVLRSRCRFEHHA